MDRVNKSETKVLWLQPLEYKQCNFEWYREYGEGKLEWYQTYGQGLLKWDHYQWQGRKEFEQECGQCKIGEAESLEKVIYSEMLSVDSVNTIEAKSVNRVNNSVYGKLELGQ